jgi:diadenosine tetraphosphate (Ap4A) HIT family hydrolase
MSEHAEKVRAAGCFTCTQNSASARPVREEILLTEHWRLAHAFGTPMPGWLVLLPLRHLTDVGELTAAESAELGSLLAAGSRAVRAVTGCAKTYVAMFAEKDGFAHTHFHLIPRAPDLSPDLLGPAVFDLLTGPPEQWVTGRTADQVSGLIRDEIARSAE